MKVYVFPSDGHGCGHYRMIWPADVLRKSGHDVIIMPPKRDTGFMVKVKEDIHGNQILTSTTVPEDADVIVLQRPAHPLQPQVIRALRANKIAVVVDMDDDMSSIHPDNIAFQTYRPSTPNPLSWRHALESCKEATLVTTSTSTLQRVYAKHGRGVVVDNFVPAAYLRFPQHESGTFGWAGTTKSHPNDLQITRGAVQRLMDEGHRFQVVGGRSQVKACLRLKDDPSCTGSIELSEWARVIGESLDVGMVPLAPTSFNTSKSRLKGIEYMAVGVPWVGSPREEYRRLHRESGCGLLADGPKDWYAKLKLLLTDDVLRKEQVEAGREFMQDQTYQANAWRWWEAWTRALEIERGRR
ncbi:MAG TPA: glycosyltransferase [Gemmatimonadales bacterium]|nr:glycosyltransferase [Gemmatimonadales bacterium]